MLQLRVTLLDSTPTIWRRVILDPRLTLAQLHTVFQLSFGWNNSHLHDFLGLGGVRYATPAPSPLGIDDFDKAAIDERKVCLAQVFTATKTKLMYEYDLGDSWMHAVVLEGTVDSETIDYPFETFIHRGKGAASGKKRAAMCIAGQLAGPPDDSGGPFGCAELLALKARATSPDQKKLSADDRERVEWLGDWNPNSFHLSPINQELSKVRVKKAIELAGE